MTPEPHDGLLGATEIRLLADRLGVRPTKQKGQNFVIDANTVVVSVSEAGQAILGWDPSEVVGRSIAEFLHPDDLDRAP